jgi:hypothetical protein
MVLIAPSSDLGVGYTFCPKKEKGDAEACASRYDTSPVSGGTSILKDFEEVVIAHSDRFDRSGGQRTENWFRLKRIETGRHGCDCCHGPY